MALAWLRDPNIAALKHPNPEKWPEMLELTSVLVQVFGGPEQPPRTSADPRTQAVLGRLAEGRTMDELRRAVRGAGKDRNYRENPSYQTLQTILRDAAQVDKFTRLLVVEPASGTMPAARPRGPVQNNHGQTGFEALAGGRK